MSNSVIKGISVVLALILANSGHAQSLRDATGPANVPPSSYTGNQWVDSKGCVYIRAGFGGRVQWIPRVNRSRVPMCGQTPTVAARVARAPAAVTLQPAPQQQTARRVVAAAATVAPVRAQRVIPAGRQVVKQVGAGVRQYFWTAAPNDGITYTITTGIPEGYELIWDDGRLNPHRGTPTYARRATPRAEYSPQPRPQSQPQPRARTQAQVQTRAAATTRSSRSYAGGNGDGRYVQVGSFGVAANAQRTAARLQGMGLPVRISNARGLRVVMIGPLRGGQLNSALSTARRSGFGDAFIR